MTDVSPRMLVVGKAAAARDAPGGSGGTRGPGTLLLWGTALCHCGAPQSVERGQWGSGPQCPGGAPIVDLGRRRPAFVRPNRLRQTNALGNINTDPRALFQVWALTHTITLSVNTSPDRESSTNSPIIK